MRRRGEGMKFSCDECGYVSKNDMICDACGSRNVEWIPVDKGSF